MAKYSGMTARSQALLSGLIVVLLTAGVLGSCAVTGAETRTKYVRRADIKLHGTWVYKGTMEDVMKATAMALETSGFRVTLRNPSKGVLMTSRKAIREEAYIKVDRNAYRSIRVAVTQRSVMFKAWFRRVGPNRIQVELIPRAFNDGAYMGFWPWGRDRMRGLWIAIRRRTELALPTPSR